MAEGVTRGSAFQARRGGHPGGRLRRLLLRLPHEVARRLRPRLEVQQPPVGRLVPVGPLPPRPSCARPSQLCCFRRSGGQHPQQPAAGGLWAVRILPGPTQVVFSASMILPASFELSLTGGGGGDKVAVGGHSGASSKDVERTFKEAVKPPWRSFAAPT